MILTIISNIISSISDLISDISTKRIGWYDEFLSYQSLFYKKLDIRRSLFCLPIMFGTFYYLCKFVVKNHPQWTSFLSICLLTTVEFVSSYCCSWSECLFYLNFLFFYFFLLNLSLFIYFYSYFYRYWLALTFVFSKYFDYWLAEINNEIWYHLIDHFYVKNCLIHLNKRLRNFLREKKIINYFIEVRNPNKHMLKYSLNKRYPTFLNIMGIVYILFFLICLYYYLFFLYVWYSWNVFMIFFRFYNLWWPNAYYLYLFIFFKLLLNSYCFNQLLSYNFLRITNYGIYHELSDGLVNWEPSYSATIMINEVLFPEDTSIYLSNWFIDIDRAERILGFRHELTTKEVTYRFLVPTRWAYCKNYIFDSYDKTFFQKLVMLMDNYTFNIFGNFVVLYIYPKSDIDFNLYLKI